MNDYIMYSRQSADVPGIFTLVGIRDLLLFSFDVFLCILFSRKIVQTVVFLQGSEKYVWAS